MELLAFEKLTDDIAYISKLGDSPNADDGLSSEELKAEFDRGVLALQTYLNETLVEKLNADVIGKLNNILSSSGNIYTGGTMAGELNMNGYPLSGLRTPVSANDAASKAYVDSKHNAAVATLPVSGWANNEQTVSVQGIASNAHVIVTPAPETWVAYTEAGVVCSEQGRNMLTFTCLDVPETSVSANILILT